MSAEQGCIVGMHWMGVFYHQGYGVSKNVTKAIENLVKADKRGNGQSSYQLYKIYTEEAEVKNMTKAYHYLTKALITGVTYFDEMQTFFSANYDELSKVFIEQKKPSSLVDRDNKTEICNMHDAYINELKVSFSTALTNDRLYHRPAGFIQDNQIWLLGVQVKHFVKQVLHFDHRDFLKSVKQDLGPMMSEVGLWALKNYAIVQK